MSTQPRRAPATDERVRDAERTKQRLLDAAFDEFAERGYAGARVSSIADRAGVNKQLISYYFGGKAGLYRELHRRWDQTERQLHPDEASLVDLVTGYLRHTLRDPRGTRLSLWQVLAQPGSSTSALEAERTDTSTVHADDQIADPTVQAAEREAIRREQDALHAHQAAGELRTDLDLPSVQLAITGMVIAPIVLPDLVAALFEERVDSSAFEERYTAEVTKIIRQLGTEPPAAGT